MRVLVLAETLYQFFQPIGRGYLYFFYSLTKDLTRGQHLMCQRMIFEGQFDGINNIAPFWMVLCVYVLFEKFTKGATS